MVTYRNTYNYMYIYDLVYIHLCSFFISWGYDTLVEMNTHSTDFLISNIILQTKEARFLGDMADFRTGAESTHDEPETFCSARSKEH